jgi:hypothetical protein
VRRAATISGGGFSLPTARRFILSQPDEMRRPVSGRDAVRSHVIDVLEAQEIKETGMKKVSTATVKQSRNFGAVLSVR